MDTLIKHLIQLNEREGYWQTQDVVLLAVSGGADSMALLDAMHRLPESQKPQLRVIHVHHHLRPEADEEAALVARACRERNLPHVQWDWDPATHPGKGLEAAAREARYQFFSKEMTASGGEAVVTAHHGDDQMETILMRLTRGSTIEGMAGIRPVRPFATGKLLRPFLGVGKEEIYAYCHRNGIDYREDASNDESAYTRNRYRQQVLPFLKEENAQAVQHFQEFSDDLLALWEVAGPQVATLVARCFSQGRGEWVLSIPQLRGCTRRVQQLVVGHFLEYIWGAERGLFQRSHVNDILKLMEGNQPQASLQFPGGRRVQRKYEHILFLEGHAAACTERTSGVQSFHAKLGLNQWLELPFNGKMGLFSYDAGQDLLAGMPGSEAILLKEGTRLPLTVRYPQAGDRIRLNPAAPFTKKLARLFIDRKIPHEQRRQTLVVQGEDGGILWVPAYAHSLHVRPASQENTGDNRPHDGYIVIYKKDDEVK